MRAATLSESNVIGVVGPIETGDAKLYVDGFKAGVLATNPDAQVNVNYIGSFSDVALASEAATTHISAGADALTGTAQMVVGAIGKAKENNVLWFASDANQASLAPSIVVASQVYHWEGIVKEMVDSIKAGTYGGKTFSANLANGGDEKPKPKAKTSGKKMTAAEARQARNQAFNALAKKGEKSGSDGMAHACAKGRGSSSSTSNTTPPPRSTIWPTT